MPSNVTQISIPHTTINDTFKCHNNKLVHDSIGFICCCQGGGGLRGRCVIHKLLTVIWELMQFLLVSNGEMEKREWLEITKWRSQVLMLKNTIFSSNLYKYVYVTWLEWWLLHTLLLYCVESMYLKVEHRQKQGHTQSNKSLLAKRIKEVMSFNVGAVEWKCIIL